MHPPCVFDDGSDVVTVGKVQCFDYIAVFMSFHANGGDLALPAWLFLWSGNIAFKGVVVCIGAHSLVEVLLHSPWLLGQPEWVGPRSVCSRASGFVVLATVAYTGRGPYIGQEGLWTRERLAQSLDIAAGRPAVLALLTAALCGGSRASAGGCQNSDEKESFHCEVVVGATPSNPTSQPVFFTLFQRHCRLESRACRRVVLHSDRRSYRKRGLFAGAPIPTLYRFPTISAIWAETCCVRTP